MTKNDHIIPAILHTSQSKLDDTSAEALLKYIKENNLEKSSKNKKKRQNKRTSSIPLHIAKSLPPTTSSVSDDHQIANFFGITTKDMVAGMKKTDLMEYGITIRCLIEDCGIPIANLHKSGLLRTFDDLVDLEFELSDLTIDRTLFNVNHLVQLFYCNYDTLVEYSNMKDTTLDFSIHELIKTDLHCWELQALSFSFDDYIEQKFMSKRHFGKDYGLSYTLAEMSSVLGLTNQGLERLKVTQKDAKEYGWVYKEYKAVCNLK
jgi:hypothetical protein